MKKSVAVVLVLLLMLVSLGGCARNTKPAVTNNKLTIVTSLFPMYDFARQVAGDKAEVKLLLPPGAESHSYEPSPADIITLNKADLFIYSGKDLEVWAERIIAGLTNDKVSIIDLSQGITLIEGDHDHDHDHHEDEHHDDEDEHHDDEDDHDEHTHLYDPHIWTSPLIAQQMVQSIAAALCYADPENAVYYKANADRYKAELKALDDEITGIVGSSARKTLFFGGRFALLYFVERYGLEHESAYPGCSTETEPSAQVIAHMIDEIKEQKIPVIFHEELIDPKVARLISEETGAEMLLFHTCHNVSREDFNKGVTYLGLMKQNILNLKKGLN